MSLVGPRPMLPGQTALYPGRAYYALRPGADRLLADLAPQRDLLRRARRLRHRLRQPDVAADRPAGAARHRPGGAARHRLLRRRAGRRLQVYAIAASGPGREALCSRARRGPRARPASHPRDPECPMRPRPVPGPAGRAFPGSVRRRRRVRLPPPPLRGEPAARRPAGARRLRHPGRSAPRRTTSGRWRCSPRATRRGRCSSSATSSGSTRRMPRRGSPMPGCCATAARPARR